MRARDEPMREMRIVWRCMVAETSEWKACGIIFMFSLVLRQTEISAHDVVWETCI